MGTCKQIARISQINGKLVLDSDYYGDYHRFDNTEDLFNKLGSLISQSMEEE